MDNLQRKNQLILDLVSDSCLEKVNLFCDEYKDFINKSKTEREAAEIIISIAKKNGFKDLSEIVKKNLN